MNRLTWLLALSLIVSSSAFSMPLVEVSVTKTTNIADLYAGGFDIVWNDGESIQIVAWDNDLARLSALGYSFNVIHEDIEAYNQSRLTTQLDDMGGYPTWSEIRTWYDGMVQTYPTLISAIDTIGYSVQNRPLWAFKISDNPNSDEEEAEVFFNSLIHAREAITPLVLMNFSEYLCENYSSDQEIQDLVNSREIWILPVVNPDGYVYNEAASSNGGGMWRKNRRDNGDGSRGVDLNRNWPYQWGYDDSGSSPNGSRQTYRGASAGSEPETQAMMDFINDHEFSIIVNYHSYSNVIMRPYNYSMGILPDDIGTYDTIIDSINLTLGWDSGAAYDMMYPTNGDAGDWQEGGCDYNTFSITIEVGNLFDNFWPPTSRIDTLCGEQIEPLKAVLRVADQVNALIPPARPEISSPETADEDFTISWTNTDDNDNNSPYTFDVIECSVPTGIDIIDPDSDVEFWDLNGFTLTTDSCYSEPAAYYSGCGEYTGNSFVSVDWYEVQQGDTLTFMCAYSIEPDWDYAYVQVSTNGLEWTTLAGNLTTNDNPNGRNFGNGINGRSNGWVQGKFPLDDYVGESILIKFRYITYMLVGEYGILIDDISPVNAFENMNAIASGTSETSLTIDYPDNLEEEEVRWYRVRCVDAQSQTSYWSNMTRTILQGATSAGEDDLLLPDRFEVSGVYPNPFNPTSSIRVSLPMMSDVKMYVYDILGREVTHYHQGNMIPGIHTLVVDGSSWSSGVYFIGVEANNENLSETIWQKAVLMK